jgi:hypothetical protein
MDEEWQYPKVTWFREATVAATAAKHGLSAAVKPEHTAFYIATRPLEIHDWIVLSRLES